MAKLRIDILVDWEILTWLNEIKNKERLKNYSQTMKYIYDRYIFMVFELNRNKNKIEKPVDSYETVRTEQIKQQQQKPLHEQGSPSFFQKYPTLQAYWDEQERKKK